MFQGRDGFEWFTGIIEDRNDPLFLNRVRVRIFGIHSYDKQKIATPDLPWAEVMMPTTTASLSGLGTTVHGLVEGSFVVGFFRDGIANQQPVVMGSFIGQPRSYSRIDETHDTDGNRISNPVERTPTEGFNDPRLPEAEDYEKPKNIVEKTVQLAGLGFTTEESTPDGKNPTHINRNYGLTLDLKGSPRRDGEDAGESYPKESYIGTSSVNELARQGGEYNKDIYPNNVIENNDGFFNKLWNLISIPKTLFDGSWWTGGENENRGKWVRPKYPFNHVYESESGHVIEIDDTPGYERINVFHRKGARFEINNEGEIHMVAAPGQDINLQGANVNIRNTGSGTLRIMAENKVDIIAKKAAKIISEGPTDIISSGETKITSLKDVIMKAVKKIKIQ